MFHSSESIRIIPTSENKSKSKTKTKNHKKSSSLLSSIPLGRQRERASTWSMSSSSNKPNKPFGGHRRQQSSSSQNSRISLRSLDRVLDRDRDRNANVNVNVNPNTLWNGNGNVNGNGGSLLSSSRSANAAILRDGGNFTFNPPNSHSQPQPQPQQLQNRQRSNSFNANGTIYSHRDSILTQKTQNFSNTFPLQLPQPPNQSPSHSQSNSNSNSHSRSPSLHSSPLDVKGVSKEGLDRWLNDSFNGAIDVPLDLNNPHGDTGYADADAHAHAHAYDSASMSTEGSMLMPMSMSGGNSHGHSREQSQRNRMIRMSRSTSTATRSTSGSTKNSSGSLRKKRGRRRGNERELERERQRGLQHLELPSISTEDEREVRGHNNLSVAVGSSDDLGNGDGNGGSGDRDGGDNNENVKNIFSMITPRASGAHAPDFLKAVLPPSSPSQCDDHEDAGIGGKGLPPTLGNLDDYLQSEGEDIFRDARSGFGDGCSNKDVARLQPPQDQNLNQDEADDAGEDSDYYHDAYEGWYDYEDTRGYGAEHQHEHGRSVEGVESNAYPPNINISTGLIPGSVVSRTLTDEDSKSFSLPDDDDDDDDGDDDDVEEHDNDHYAPVDVDTDDNTNDNTNDRKSVNHEMESSSLGGAATNTFDTPNSKRSIRFMDEVQGQHQLSTPGSFKRMPPESLMMKDGNGGGSGSGEYLQQSHSHGYGYRHGSSGSFGAYSHSASGRMGLTSMSASISGTISEGSDLEDMGYPNSVTMNLNSKFHSSPSRSKESTSLASLEDGSMGGANNGGDVEGGGSVNNGVGVSSNGEGNDKGERRRSQQPQYMPIWTRLCCCFPYHSLSWSRVSNAVVRYAPCFWCCCRRSQMGGGTDRAVLIKLNVMCAVFALWQFVIGVFVLVVFLSTEIVERNLDGISAREYAKKALAPNLWMCGFSLLALAVVGFVLFNAMVFTIPIIRQVNLVGALRFMWVLYWILPMQIFFVIALFDYHNVTDVWIKHWWASPSMAWFRSFFCAQGTANTKCAVPYKGGANFLNETAWCEENYNGAVDCENIRASAVSEMSRMSYFMFYLNAIIGGVLLVLLLLCLGLLEGLISAPIVQRSKETNIPLWLTFPTLGCFLCGVLLRFSPQSFLVNEPTLPYLYWIRICYMISGTTFAISALLGWFISAKNVLSLRDKKQKVIAIYLFNFMLACTIIAVGAIFLTSILFSLDIVSVDFQDDVRGTIACYIDASGSCSNCDCTSAELEDGCTFDPFQTQCPEWTSKDVSKIVQTQLKQSATLAAIFFIYAYSALRFGWELWKLQSKYQIAYV